MTELPENPFASPTANLRSTPEDTDLENAPMPASVVALLVALSISLLVKLLVIIGGDSTLIIPLIAGVLILVGLVRGNRLAWFWGRICGILGSFVYGLILLAGLYCIANFAEMQKAMVDDADLAQLDANSLKFFLYIGTVTVAFLFATCVAMFAVLGRTPARRFFTAICPSCGCKVVKASDYFFSTAQCALCDKQWD